MSAPTPIWPVPTETDSQDVRTSYPQPKPVRCLPDGAGCGPSASNGHAKVIHPSIAIPSAKHASRRMDKQGLHTLQAYEYRLAPGLDNRTSGFSPPFGERGEAAPPTLLGGVKGINIGKMDAGERKASIGMDWLQGTIPFEKMDLLFHYLNMVSGSKPEIYDHGFMGYQAAAEWHPFGIKVMWDLNTVNRLRHANRIVLQIGGAGLGCFPAASLYQFCRDLIFKFWFKATRCDLCFDDYDKIIRPKEIDEFAEQGSYKGFRKYKFIHGSNLKGESTDEGIYFGTRGKSGGGKLLRCYAKDIESNGETDSIRWEIEFSKERAALIFFELAMAADLEDFSTKIGDYIGGSIDFIERDKSGKFNPLDRLAFWEQILHHLGSASLRFAQPDGSIETSMEWVEKSVVPSIEKIRRAIGDSDYHEWLDGLMDRVELRHKATEQIRMHHNMYGNPTSNEAYLWPSDSAYLSSVKYPLP